MWPQRDKEALHLVFAYIGPSANEQVEYIAARTPESTPETTIERREHDGLLWSYACIAPAALCIDGMAVYLHLEAYEGIAPQQRARLDHVDGVCVILDPSTSLLPFLPAQLVAQRAEACGHVWAELPVCMQVLGDGNLADLREMTGETERAWFVVSPSSGHGVFDTLKQLTKLALTQYRAGTCREFVPGNSPLIKPPGVMKIDPDDDQLVAAFAQARATLDELIAKLASPGDSQMHAIQTRLAEGDVFEHVWLIEPRWDGKRFVAKLDNEPVDLHNVRIGDIVQVEPSAVQDWMYFEDGELRGGYTIRLHAQRGDIAAGALTNMGGRA